MKAWPAMLGTTAGTPPTSVIASIRLSNLVPMIDSCTNRSPTPISPLARMTASRAEVPVPHGDLSIRPGETITALRAVRTPSGRDGGRVNSVIVIPANSGFSGCTAGSCPAAACLIRCPARHRSRPSSGVSRNPALAASTST